MTQLEPESKIVPLIYSNGDYSNSERIAQIYAYPSQVMCKAKWNTNVIAKYFAFLQELQNSHF